MKEIICELWECCREVRLGATPCKVGDKLTGWNTIKDQYEEWIVIEVNSKDNWKSLVKRVFNE